MEILKEGGRNLFGHDQAVTDTVSRMLLDIEHRGIDAVREYSERLDGWNPSQFELSRHDIEAAAAKLPQQVIEDTDFCQENVRQFARAQRETMLPLEVETRPGVVLGHKHIPLSAVGSYVPGG